MTELTIFGYAGASNEPCCDPGSGCCDPSPVEVAQAIQKLVEEKFPGEYRVKFVDTFSIDAFDYNDVLQAIQDQNLGLPVLAIGGAPRLSGNFTMAEVEQALQEVRTA